MNAATGTPEEPRLADRRLAGFPRHVLVAVDGSRESMAAAALAAELVTGSGGRVTVLAVVVLPPSMLDAIDGPGVAAALAATAHDMTHEAVDVLRRAGIEAAVTQRRLGFGGIGREIAAAATEHRCDLVAVGHGRALGSVALRVVSEARCPVAIVPAPREGSRGT